MLYYDNLPEGYKEKFTIDASDNKFGVLLNLIGIIPFITIVLVSWFLMGFSFDLLFEEEVTSLITTGVFLVALVVYILLHELTHGLFYKIFTRKKLTFGLKLSCAYCGVPDIYSKKWPMVFTSLAPFVLFSIPSILALIFLPASIISFAVVLFLAIHVSGCIGDIFVAILLVHYPKDVLIKDTGPKQSFYLKEE